MKTLEINITMLKKHNSCFWIKTLKQPSMTLHQLKIDEYKCGKIAATYKIEESGNIYLN